MADLAWVRLASPRPARRSVQPARLQKPRARRRPLISLITPVAGSKGSSSHPWATLSSAEMVTQPRDLIIKEVNRMVPELTTAKL